MTTKNVTDLTETQKKFLNESIKALFVAYWKISELSRAIKPYSQELPPGDWEVYEALVEGLEQAASTFGNALESLDKTLSIDNNEDSGRFGNNSGGEAYRRFLNITFEEMRQHANADCDRKAPVLS